MVESINAKKTIKQIRRGLSIYRTGRSPFWHARIYDPVKKKYVVRSTKETNRIEAIEVAEEILETYKSKQNSSHATSKDRSFEYYAKLLADLNAQKSKSPRNKYTERDQNKLLFQEREGLISYFGKYDVGKITSGMVREYLLFLDKQRAKPLALSTKSKRCGVIRQVLMLALEDGVIDIIWASWDWHGTAGKSVCLWNDGTGRMTSKICADIGGMQVKHGDFNADGHIDMLIADYSSECVKWAGGYKKLRMQSRQRGTSRILFGDGSRNWTYKRSSEIKSFGKMPSGAPICHMPTTTVFDIDNDGDQDIVANTVGYNYVGEYFSVFENDGYGNFTSTQTLSVTGKEPPKSWRRFSDFPKVEFGHGYGGGYCQRYLMVDFNEDGFIDVQCSTHVHKRKANHKIWMNLGDGTFRAATGQDTFPYITPF